MVKTNSSLMKLGTMDAGTKLSPSQGLKDSCRWETNIRWIKFRIKERLRVVIASQNFLRQRSQRRGVGGTPAWRATGLAVARVLQDNSMMATVARSVARQECQKRVGWLNVWMFKLRSALGLSAVGATLMSASEPVQGEPLVLQSPVAAVDTPAIDRRSKRDMKLDYYEEKGIAVAREHSQVWQMLQAVVLPVVANSCRFYMNKLNFTEVHGTEKLRQALLHRPKGQALITVSNHVASMDDPLVMATLLPHHLMLQSPRLRWTLCATNQCFSNAAVSAFFHCVKVLPVKRGGGIHQEGLDIAVGKVRQGDWVHIFPEGGRSRDGGKTIGPLKRGIGRLVADVETTPLVIPFVHSGMQDMMPIGSKLPATGKKITVLVGDPIDLEDMVKTHVQAGVSEAALHNVIALEVGMKMKELKAELDQLVLARNLQDAAKATENIQMLQRVQGLWQFVDWEAQGLTFEEIQTREEFALLPPQDTPAPCEERVAPEEYEANEMEVSARQNAQSDRGPIEVAGGLAHLSGFGDPISFLELGFAVRGLLSTAVGMPKKYQRMGPDKFRPGT